MPTGVFTQHTAQLDTPVFDHSLLQRKSLLRIRLMYRILMSVSPRRGVFESTWLDFWRSMPFLLYRSRKLLRIRPSGWHLFTPSWWGSKINTLLSSNVHFPLRKLHTNTARTHTLIQRVHYRHRPSMPDSWQNTHGNHRQTRMHMLKTLTRTKSSLAP